MTETVARELLGEHFDRERFLAESRFDADLAEEVVVRDRFLQCVMAAAWSDEEMAALIQIHQRLGSLALAESLSTRRGKIGVGSR